MINLTLESCNVSLPYAASNETETDKVYVNECLGRKTCMLVSECSRLIEEHVFPGFSEWIIITVYSVIFFLGLVGNGLVCFVVIRITHMRTIVNIFILNLAVADFLVLLICLPPSMLADTTESWYLGNVMCKVVPFLQTVSVAVSVLSLSAISIERYFAICHPLRVRLNAKKMSVFIVIIWIAAALIALPEILYQELRNTYPDYVTPYLKYCRLSMSPVELKSYQIFLMVILYDFPMCLMFFAYTTISVRLWKDTFSGAKEDRCLDSDFWGLATLKRLSTEKRICRTKFIGRPRRCQTSRPENQVQTRRKAAKMLMTIVVLFAGCYLPVHVLNILMYNGSLREWDDVAIVTYALIARGLCYLNSAINPVIYNFMSAKFRQEFRAALYACKCAWKEDTKTPVALYNFRMNRSAMTRSDRYTMNTLTSRQNYFGRSISSNKKSAL